MILDDWLAVDGQRWASLKCGLSVPRQNGKNGALEVRELFGMIGRGEKILHTAHQVKTAQKHFRRLKHFFGKKANDETARYPELNALVEELRNVNGQEAIYLRNGGSVEIVARSQGSGRGFTVDVIVCDEAQDMSDDDLEALLATSSAGPLGDPQWIFTGTPPGPRANGEVFTRNRVEALGGKAGKSSWHEWAADMGDDLDSLDVWRKANPALGTRLLVDVVAGERSTFSDDGFMRERLGMWEQAVTSHVVSPEAWAVAAGDAPESISSMALAVDVAPDLASASVAFAGQCPDGAWHVELDEQRSGAEWVPRYVAEKLASNPKVRAVVVDAGSPAAAILDDMAKLRVKVTSPRVREFGAACARFVDGVRLGDVRHIDQTALNHALSVARKRRLGDTELWAWNRKNAGADITPVVAVTLALWGAQNSNVARPSRSPDSGRVVVLS